MQCRTCWIRDSRGRQLQAMRSIAPLAMGVVEKVSEGHRLTTNGVQVWGEFHVTKVTEVAREGIPPPPSERAHNQIPEGQADSDTKNAVRSNSHR